MRHLLSTILVIAAFLAACGDDPPSSNASTPDGGTPDAGPIDMGEEDASKPQDMTIVDMSDGSTLCAPCAQDDDCDEGGLCVTLFDDESVCGSACESAEDCPESYICAVVDEETEATQCIPEELTCVDRCSDVSCGTNERCDPLTGECARPLRLCETGCVTDSQCGDGPEDRCLSIPNAPDGERSCFVGCDPEAEVRECPADYFCVPLDAETDPNDGVCFPFEGTCVDRCVGVDCGPGQNCDPVTGACTAAIYGACEFGCSTNAECGGQDDVCLNLGLNDAPTCWQSCAGNTDSCPAGYECLGVTATSLRICIPTSRDCSLCEGAGCYPDGVCNPTDGTCSDLPQSCTPGTCPAGEYCDPLQLVCQSLGRPCSGSSWAIDCDNVVTKCTTQKAGVDGTCEALCSTDSDCDPGTTCVETSVGNLCLGYRDGGAELCGASYESSSRVGAPCGPGTCVSGAPNCQENLGLDGFCSRGCSDDADCDAGQSCEVGPRGVPVCITEQCECAIDPGLPLEIELGLEAGFLPPIDFSPCNDLFEPAARAANGYAPLALSDDVVTTLNAYPFATLGRRDRMIFSPGSLQDAWERTTLAAGRPTSGSAVTPTYPGTNSILAEAVADLVRATGGVPNLAALDTSAGSVPTAVQEAAAPYISAAARAYLARRNAVGVAGWSATDIDAAIADAPFLFLPGRTNDAAPDLTDPTVAAEYEAFPTDDLAQIMADLAADIDAAKPAANLTDVGFTFDVTTPAGRVIVGDAANTSHDDAAGAVAVIIDIGGDDTYRGALGSNASSANGVSLVVDLGGADTWTYDEVADPNDTADLLPSDADGRIPAAGPLFNNNGPVSASTVGRQASARFGLAATIDYGPEDDVRESLRMSQASSLFGAALLYDEDGNDQYDAEALAQGAALSGTALLWDAGGDDQYRVWHAGQGFGTAGGTGALVDSSGTDQYLAVPGGAQAAGVLYYSPVDRGASNRNLAQGASAGIEGGIDGGFGLLHDLAGSDFYRAGTYAQGHGALGGVGFTIDSAGSDVREGRGYVQGAGERHGGGVLVDLLGDDTYNPTFARRQRGQGVGAEGGWGIIYDAAGEDDVTYIAPAGGAGLDGGLGMALFGPGVTTHDASSDATWGYAANTVMMGTFASIPTYGFFIDAGGVDIYSRPDTSIITQGGSWLQPAVPGLVAGYGADR